MGKVIFHHPAIILPSAKNPTRHPNSLNLDLPARESAHPFPPNKSRRRNLTTSADANFNSPFKNSNRAGQSVSRGHGASSNFSASLPRKNLWGFRAGQFCQRASRRTNENRRNATTDFPANQRQFCATIQPKMSGLPGRTLTCEKTISKPSHSNNGRVKSLSPTLAPPETKTTSARSICDLQFRSCQFRQLQNFPANVSASNRTGKFCSRPRIKMELLSRICPGFGVWSGGIISSPGRKMT